MEVRRSTSVYDCAAGGSALVAADLDDMLADDCEWANVPEVIRAALRSVGGRLRTAERRCSQADAEGAAARRAAERTREELAAAQGRADLLERRLQAVSRSAEERAEIVRAQVLRDIDARVEAALQAEREGAAATDPVAALTASFEASGYAVFSRWVDASVGAAAAAAADEESGGGGGGGGGTALAAMVHDVAAASAEKAVESFAASDVRPARRALESRVSALQRAAGSLSEEVVRLASAAAAPTAWVDKAALRGACGKLRTQLGETLREGLGDLEERLRNERTRAVPPGPSAAQLRDDVAAAVAAARSDMAAELDERVQTKLSAVEDAVQALQTSVRRDVAEATAEMNDSVTGTLRAKAEEAAAAAAEELRSQLAESSAELRKEVREGAERAQEGVREALQAADEARRALDEALAEQASQVEADVRRQLDAAEQTMQADAEQNVYVKMSAVEETVQALQTAVRRDVAEATAEMNDSVAGTLRAKAEEAAEAATAAMREQLAACTETLRALEEEASRRAGEDRSALLSDNMAAAVAAARSDMAAELDERVQTKLSAVEDAVQALQTSVRRDVAEATAEMNDSVTGTLRAKAEEAAAAAAEELRSQLAESSAELRKEVQEGAERAQEGVREALRAAVEEAAAAAQEEVARLQLPGGEAAAAAISEAREATASLKADAERSVDAKLSAVEETVQALQTAVRRDVAEATAEMNDSVTGTLRAKAEEAAEAATAAMREQLAAAAAAAEDAARTRAKAEEDAAAAAAAAAAREEAAAASQRTVAALQDEVQEGLASVRALQEDVRQGAAEASAALCAQVADAQESLRAGAAAAADEAASRGSERLRSEVLASLTAAAASGGGGSGGGDSGDSGGSDSNHLEESLAALSSVVEARKGLLKVAEGWVEEVLRHSPVPQTGQPAVPCSLASFVRSVAVEYFSGRGCDDGSGAPLSFSAGSRSEVNALFGVMRRFPSPLQSPLAAPAAATAVGGGGGGVGVRAGSLEVAEPFTPLPTTPLGDPREAARAAVVEWAGDGGLEAALARSDALAAVRREAGVEVLQAWVEDGGLEATLEEWVDERVVAALFDGGGGGGDDEPSPSPGGRRLRSFFDGRLAAAVSGSGLATREEARALACEEVARVGGPAALQAAVGAACRRLKEDELQKLVAAAFEEGVEGDEGVLRPAVEAGCARMRDAVAPAVRRRCAETAEALVAEAAREAAAGGVPEALVRDRVARAAEACVEAAGAGADAVAARVRSAAEALVEAAAREAAGVVDAEDVRARVQAAVHDGVQAAVEESLGGGAAVGGGGVVGEAAVAAQVQREIVDIVASPASQGYQRFAAAVRGRAEEVAGRVVASAVADARETGAPSAVAAALGRTQLAARAEDEVRRMSFPAVAEAAAAEPALVAAVDSAAQAAVSAARADALEQERRRLEALVGEKVAACVEAHRRAVGEDTGDVVRMLKEVRQGIKPAVRAGIEANPAVSAVQGVREATVEADVRGAFLSVLTKTVKAEAEAYLATPDAAGRVAEAVMPRVQTGVEAWLGEWEAGRAAATVPMTPQNARAAAPQNTSAISSGTARRIVDEKIHDHIEPLREQIEATVSSMLTSKADEALVRDLLEAKMDASAVFRELARLENAKATRLEAKELLSKKANLNDVIEKLNDRPVRSEVQEMLRHLREVVATQGLQDSGATAPSTAASPTRRSLSGASSKAAPAVGHPLAGIASTHTSVSLPHAKAASEVSAGTAGHRQFRRSLSPAVLTGRPFLPP